MSNLPDDDEFPDDGWVLDHFVAELLAPGSPWVPAAGSDKAEELRNEAHVRLWEREIES